MPIRGLLLDLDGTLIDSNDQHAEAWQKAFAHFGRIYPVDLVRTQIGKGGDYLVPDLLSAKEVREIGEELPEYRSRLFRDSYRESVRPFPKVREALETFRDHGLRMVLASSSNEEDLDWFVELLGIADLLDGRTTADDVDAPKPAPDIFAAALRMLDMPAEDVLVVGDTPWDILAAHRNGLAIAAVRSGGFPSETLGKAEIIVDDIHELATHWEDLHATV